MNKDEALKLALEAHKKNESHRTVAETRYWCEQYKLLAEQAIEQAQQAEPVALEAVYEIIIHWDESGGKRSRRELARRIVDLYTSPPQRKEPEQEPVAWVVYSSAENDIVWTEAGKNLKAETPLYTTPPPRQPLTDEAIATVYWGATGQSLRPQDNVLAHNFARAIEQAHGIKGEA